VCSLHLILLQLRRIGWAGHKPRVGEMRNSNRILIVRLEGERLLRRAAKLVCEGVDCSRLTWYVYGSMAGFCEHVDEFFGWL
jgi:hypothetical protein